MGSGLKSRGCRLSLILTEAAERGLSWVTNPTHSLVTPSGQSCPVSRVCLGQFFVLLWGDSPGVQWPCCGWRCPHRGSQEWGNGTEHQFQQRCVGVHLDTGWSPFVHLWAPFLGCLPSSLFCKPKNPKVLSTSCSSCPSAFLLCALSISSSSLSSSGIPPGWADPTPLTELGEAQCVWNFPNPALSWLVVSAEC